MEIPAKLPLIIKANHLLTHRSPGDWLIDTGSPQSFGDAPFDVPVDATHRLPKSYGGVDTNYIRKTTGIGCVGLIGCDVLNKYDLVFELSHNSDSGHILFSKNTDMAPKGTRVPIHKVGTSGIPIVEVNVRGRGPVRMLFDTGAQHSYLDTLAGLETEPYNVESDETPTDFHPSCGSFDVKLHKVAVGLGSVKANLRFATQADTNAYPTPVRKLLEKTGAEGVLGLEILRHGPMAYLPRWGELWI